MSPGPHYPVPVTHLSSVTSPVLCPPPQMNLCGVTEPSWMFPRLLQDAGWGMAWEEVRSPDPRLASPLPATSTAGTSQPPTSLCGWKKLKSWCAPTSCCVSFAVLKHQGTLGAKQMPGIWLCLCFPVARLTFMNTRVTAMTGSSLEPSHLGTGEVL